MNLKTVSVGTALGWLRRGWQLSARQWGRWIGLNLAGVLVLALASSIPRLGGLLSGFLGPLLYAGLFRACRRLEGGEALAFADLWVGLSEGERRKPLLALGGLGLGVSLLFFLLGLAMGSSSAMVAMGGTGLEGGVAGALLAWGWASLLGSLLLALAATMAFVYAVPLVLFRPVGALEALKLSFIACLQNAIPLTVVGLLWAVLAVLASLPLLLGWLVLGPVTVAAVYASYQDLFESQV